LRRVAAQRLPNSLQSRVSQLLPSLAWPVLLQFLLRVSPVVLSRRRRFLFLFLGFDLFSLFHRFGGSWLLGIFDGLGWNSNLLGFFLGNLFSCRLGLGLFFLLFQL